MCVLSTRLHAKHIRAHACMPPGHFGNPEPTRRGSLGGGRVTPCTPRTSPGVLRARHAVAMRVRVRVRGPAPPRGAAGIAVAGRPRRRAVSGAGGTGRDRQRFHGQSQPPASVSPPAKVEVGCWLGHSSGAGGGGYNCTPAQCSRAGGAVPCWGGYWGGGRVILGRLKPRGATHLWAASRSWGSVSPIPRSQPPAVPGSPDVTPPVSPQGGPAPVGG